MDRKRRAGTTDGNTDHRRLPLGVVLAALLAALALSAGCAAGAQPAPAKDTKAAAPAAPTAAKPPTKVRLGYAGTMPGVVIIAADRLGFFKEQGLEVAATRFGAGKEIRDAVVARSLDGGQIGIQPFLVGAVKGDMLGISTAGLTGSGLGLVSKPEITKVEDLKGKKVATQFGSNNHLILVNDVLPAYNLRPTDLQLINMKGDDLLSALSAGQVDAIAWAEPSLATAVVRGVGRRLLTFEKWDPAPHVMTYDRNFLAANPQVGIATIRALLQASDLLKKDLAKAAELAAADDKQRTGTEPDLRIHQESLRNFNPGIEFFPDFQAYVSKNLAALQKDGSITSSPPFEQLFEVKYLKEAVQR